MGSTARRPIDAEGFYRDLQALRARAEASLGPDDLRHLRRIERLGRLATAVGFATAPLGPNPVSVLALTAGRSTRWLLMHHLGHRGYDRVPGVPLRYTGRVFAHGRRRYLDWFDWRVPEAWIYEHNVQHHSFTGSETDPDRIEPNVRFLHKLPMWRRWATFWAASVSWNYGYALQVITRGWLARHGTKPSRKQVKRVLWRESWLPFAGIQFVGIPLLYAPLGPLAVASVAANSALAELLTNFHAYLVIAPSHTGEDLYLFTGKPVSKAEGAVRQVLGSTNYPTGRGDLWDWFYLFLNYQIEHHLFPDLPMTTYQRIQPEVREICERYGVPYVQEGVFRRFMKFARVFVGQHTQRKDAAEEFGITG